MRALVDVLGRRELGDGGVERRLVERPAVLAARGLHERREVRLGDVQPRQPHDAGLLLVHLQHGNCDQLTRCRPNEGSGHLPYARESARKAGVFFWGGDGPCNALHEPRLSRRPQSCARTHPAEVLLVSALEVDHPVSERLERVGRETAPDVGDLPVEESARHVVQLAAHPNLSRQCLQRHNQRHTAATNTTEQSCVSRKSEAVSVSCTRNQRKKAAVRNQYLLESDEGFSHAGDKFVESLQLLQQHNRRWSNFNPEFLPNLVQVELLRQLREDVGCHLVDVVVPADSGPDVSCTFKRSSTLHIQPAHRPLQRTARCTVPVCGCSSTR